MTFRKGPKKLGMNGGKPRVKTRTITSLKKELWQLCKLITRKRYGLPNGTYICYTSGKLIIDPKDAHTGHFIHSSLCSVELRYDLNNLRIQSYDQNINKNGNTLQFQENLIQDHGAAYVRELVKRNQATKGLQYGKDWYINKIVEYQSLLETL